MPRAIRIALTGLSFLIFFLGSALIGLVLFPLLFVAAGFDLRRHRDRCTRLVGWGYGTFLFWMRLAGLIEWGPPVHPPPELRDRAYVLVANHPSLIDVLFLLHWFRPRLTSLVKAAWYRSLFFGPLLRSTHYLPGASAEELDAAIAHDGEAPVVRRMTAHLRAGHPIVVFPEGTRSAAGGLRPFKRGAFEAAVAAGVPIVRVFIAVDRPMLMKGVPFWHVPPRRARWDFELLPTVDTAGRTGRALRNALQADYEARFAEYVACRDAALAAEAAGDGAARPAAGGSAPAPDVRGASSGSFESSPYTRSGDSRS